MLDLQTKDQEKYFLHEHPKSAKSWKKETSERPNVEIVEGPMCRWKMVGRDASGEGRIRKPTYWMTNSPELAETLRGVCTNDLPGAKRERHRHIHLVNGRAKMARIYPPALVRAVLRALKRQMKADGEYREVHLVNAGPSPDEEMNLEEYEGDFVPGRPRRSTTMTPNVWKMNLEEYFGRMRGGQGAQRLGQGLIDEGGHQLRADGRSSEGSGGRAPSSNGSGAASSACQRDQWRFRWRKQTNWMETEI